MTVLSWRNVPLSDGQEGKKGKEWRFSRVFRFYIRESHCIFSVPLLTAFVLAAVEFYFYDCSLVCILSAVGW